MKHEKMQVKSSEDTLPIIDLSPLLNKDASDEDIVRAAKIANVDEIASDLPDGYETVLAEGGKQLSGGQRQAICIARAFVGDPKIIILDEPSSAKDSGSEQQLLNDLIPLLTNKTLVATPRRESTSIYIDR